MGDLVLPMAHHVAVIGCGDWGTNIARTLSHLGVLAVVVDEDNERAQSAAARHKVPQLPWQTVMEDPCIDAVAIATPVSSHARLAAEALGAGKSVFVEKPLAASVREAEVVRAAAEKQKSGGAIAMVGHLYRYHPAFIKLKSLCDEGALGSIRGIYSTRFNLGKVRHEEDALWSLAPHDISMILALVGNGATQRLESVTAHASHLLGRERIADAVTASLVFGGGLEAQISVSWAYPIKERRLIVVGDKGMAVFDDCEHWDAKLIIHHHKLQQQAVGGETLVSAVRGPSEAIKLEACEPLRSELEHFLRCVAVGREPTTGLEEGLSVLKTLEAIDKAIRPQSSVHPGTGPNLGLDYKIHTSAHVDDLVTIGAGTSIWHFCHIMEGARIGRDCNLGQNVFVDHHVTMGDRCKIQNNVSIYNKVTLEDGVFCGPSCVFTNVLTPRAEVDRKAEFLPTLVRRGATVGANATVVCGVELGEYCMVGAGAVVTKDVAPYALVTGSPARRIGWVSASGERMGNNLVCPRTGDKYIVSEDGCRLSRLASSCERNGQNLAPTEMRPLVDLKSQRQALGKALDERITKIIDEANFIMGPEVFELEARLAEFTGAKYALTCASGTDAIMLALMALGLQPGDAVLVPTFTFVATVEPVVLLGGIPVFLDVEPDQLTLDPSLISAGVEEATKSGRRVVGVIAVDMFGHPADYASISRAIKSHSSDLWVIADAAQSFGATVDDRGVGTLADVTTTSFFPSKPLGCYGDGGAVFTDNEKLAKSIESLRQHGRRTGGTGKFDSDRVGMNSRLDTIQAAVLLSKLEIFPSELSRRHEIAERYAKSLCGHWTPPMLRPGCTSPWASYTIRTATTEVRELRRQQLRQAGYPSVVYYPKPIHTMDAYKHFPVVRNGCPVAEMLGEEMLSLPMHAYLTEEDQDEIVEVLGRTNLD